MYDLLIVGGGPAGVMCAIQAQSKFKKIALIEKNSLLLKKFRMSGNGRSNILNIHQNDEFLKHIHSYKFFYSALKQVNTQTIYDYFENIGIPLKVEDHGRVYPQCENANIVAEKLIQQLKHVDIYLNTNVTNIESGYTIFTPHQQFQCKKLVIATGGISFPSTGSTGDGYLFAEKLNHSVQPTYPVETPLISNDSIIQSKALQGISLQDVIIRVISNNKNIELYQHDIIFTHFGLSGPASLGVSEAVYQSLHRKKATHIQIDFLPNYHIDELFSLIRKNTKTHLWDIFKTLLPQRLLSVLLQKNQILEKQNITEISSLKLTNFLNDIKNFMLIVHGVKPIQYAFVTGGGISLKEINPNDFSSKIHPNLYFIGEVLDLHGKIGGYNLSLCFIEGYLLGKKLKD